VRSLAHLGIGQPGEEAVDGSAVKGVIPQPEQLERVHASLLVV
jgi:hypothetical protein